MAVAGTSRTASAAPLPAAALLLSGCAATIHCPEVEGEARVATLLDHGTHASLVIEDEAGAGRRYSYGDRRWYAEGDTGIAAGFSALFRRTPAVLGRIVLRTATDTAAVEAELGLEVEHAYVFRVPADGADALLGGLDDVFARAASARIPGMDPRIEFVPHPRPYAFFSRNSNHMVAGWMEELGCDTSGNPFLSRWRVADGSR